MALGDLSATLEIALDHTLRIIIHKVLFHPIHNLFCDIGASFAGASTLRGLNRLGTRLKAR